MGRLTVKTDGSAKPNPGQMRIGVVILDGKRILKRFGKNVGYGTNNMAEYMAAIEGLKSAIELGANEVNLLVDSELLYKQLTGHYSVKSKNIKPLFREIKRLLKRFDFFTVNWVPREKNKDADYISKQRPK